ncbi:MAG: SDR family NAD(P)-dependent oxidoreductase [Legionella sp.]|uniref:SDR family NAD(P)-dependent oxidoreductase n=1 Tax=Legionella sp. TaxID=459 RepID=UPI0039E3ED58
MAKKKIVVIGATSVIAVNCARLWVTQAPVEMTLIGRNEARLDMVAADLRVRSPQSHIESLTTDFNNPEVIASLVKQLYQNGSIDLVLIAHGALLDQQQCQESLDLCYESLLVNGVSPVLFAEAFAKHMEQVNSGSLVLISSVAGDRGRKSNYIYGAAKGLINRYAQGLQHRLAKTNVQVILIKPGPTDTPMTAHLKSQGQRLANPARVAEVINKGIEKQKTVIYAPTLWRYIMTVICCIPNFIFAKMDI